jgi:hypothetical protein
MTEPGMAGPTRTLSLASKTALPTQSKTATQTAMLRPKFKSTLKATRKAARGQTLKYMNGHSLRQERKSSLWQRQRQRQRGPSRPGR